MPRGFSPLCALLFASLCLSVAAAGGKGTRYLLYSVKAGEGFNLRRDVHMRAASLVRNLQEKTGSNWVLVLPPWPWMYHWKSSERVPYQPWSKFFDLPSLNEFVPSIEFDDYLEINGHLINEVMVLQNFKGEFTTETFGQIEEQPCSDEQHRYKRTESRRWEGSVFGRRGLAIRTHHCFSAMGHTSLIFPHLQKMTGNSILVENFESLLHDRFGDANYWLTRYSMVYAAHLREAGNAFMRETLNYRGTEGGTGREPAAGGGGNYIAVHLRRRDYMYAHKDSVPSLEGAASQLNALKTELGLDAVFLASDAPLEEKKALLRMVKGLVWYAPSDAEHRNYGDGGVAIIDQWVSAHAKYFIGTAHSTFSFRIREDRQFLHFSKESTFNDICGPSDNEHDPHSCKKPSYWKWDEGGPPKPLHVDRDEL